MDIINATPEEVKAVNRALVKLAVKKVVLGVVVGAAIGVALTALAKKQNDDAVEED